MCGVPEAQLALAVIGTVSKFQSDKRVYKDNLASQKKTMEHANVAYLNDLSRIDAETSRVDQARALEQLRMRQELTKNQAYALNSGFGNSIRVVQDISGAHDAAYGELLFDVEKDFMTLQNQEQDAYANLHRTYSGMEHLQPPSMMAAGLQLAGAGLTYGASDNKWINKRKKPTVDYDAVQ